MRSENIMKVNQIVHISNIKVLLKLSSHIFSTCACKWKVVILSSNTNLLMYARMKKKNSVRFYVKVPPFGSRLVFLLAQTVELHTL